MKVLILDAMGVIYASGDDVEELLIPFLKSKGVSDISKIKSLYHDASLGKFKSYEFWGSLKLSPAIEDDYLSLHSLVPGLNDFLLKAKEKVSSVWCLSNDVAEWSEKLRKHFEIEHFFDGFIISGDVGVRKPDQAIYEHFIDVSTYTPAECIFVDDRVKNLDAAKKLGFQTIKFGEAEGNHKGINTYMELYEIL